MEASMWRLLRHVWCLLSITLIFHTTQATLPSATKVIDLVRKEIAKNSKTKSVLNKKSSTTQTATDAYLKVNKSLVDTTWAHDLKKYKSLIQTLIKQERAHSSTHFVFYHGQQGYLRLLQDFLKEMYQLFALKELRDFTFLRPWHNAEPSFEVNRFIDSCNQKGYWNDAEPDIMKKMMCVNLALFGNTTDFGECTWNYFINNTNIMPPDLEKIFNDIFAYFDFNATYIQQLLNLENETKPAHGNLLQIFIPKDQVNKYVYLSKPYGIPYQEPIAPDVFDSDKKRHIAITPILEKYIKQPTSITNLDQLQARLLLSQDGILNPESGVKIFRHTAGPIPNEAQYKKKLKDMCIQIFKDWLANWSFKNYTNHSLITRMPLYSFLKNMETGPKSA